MQGAIPGSSTWGNAMSRSGERHLRQDHTVRAAIDRSDLRPDRQNHLSVCRECQAAVTELEATLASLGKAARQHTPAPNRQIELHQKELRMPAFPFRHWQAAVGSALAGLALVCLIWGSFLGAPKSVQTADLKPESPANSETIITEISIMLADILPPEYQEIASGTVCYFDDSFVEFLMPVIEDNPIIRNQKKKGMTSC